MPNDKQSRAELVEIPFAWCCGSDNLETCRCQHPDHGIAEVTAASLDLARVCSGVDAVDLEMLKRGDLLGGRVGAAIYAGIEALKGENARLREALEQIDQKLTRSRKEPMIFLPSEIERAAGMARSALNPEREEK